MNTYIEAYQKAVHKADGILEWHRSIVDKMHRVHAAIEIEEYEGVYTPEYRSMYSELDKQRKSAERDYARARDAVTLTWMRVMKFGKRWQ